MRDKRLATAVATLLVAFATAHLMQFGMTAGQLISGGGQAQPIGLATLVARQIDRDPAILPEGPSSLPAPADAAAALASPVGRALPRDAGLPPTLDRPRGNVLGLSCERRLTARPGPGAILRAEIEAPCDPGVRVELSHAGLRFAIETGGDGRLRADIPAMVPDATVAARFADGSILTSRAAIPEAAGLTRIAVVADGWTGLTLVAVELAPGRGAPAPAREGTMVRLGDPQVDAPLFAQVYTQPAGRFGTLGRVRLGVETVVTPANCARDIRAELVRSGGMAAPVRLGLAVPSCDAAGEMLALPLPPTDLRLAGN